MSNYPWNKDGYGKCFFLPAFRTSLTLPRALSLHKGTYRLAQFFCCQLLFSSIPVKGWLNCSGGGRGDNQDETQLGLAEHTLGIHKYNAHMQRWGPSTSRHCYISRGFGFSCSIWAVSDMLSHATQGYESRESTRCVRMSCQVGRESTLNTGLGSVLLWGLQLDEWRWRFFFFTKQVSKLHSPDTFSR